MLFLRPQDAAKNSKFFLDHLVRLPQYNTPLTMLNIKPTQLYLLVPIINIDLKN